MKFNNLKLTEWRQFNNIEIEFHPRLTIITGANGAGKSTILKILSQHFGWSHHLLATPKMSKEGKRYFSGLFGNFRKERILKETNLSNFVGQITYNNSLSANLIAPDNNNVTYNLEIRNQQQVEGLHILSHRQVQNYQAVVNIPVNPITANQAYQQYFSDTQQRYQGGHTQYSTMYRIKEAIISMATFGAGNQYVEKNKELEKLFLDFKDVLSKVLPPTIGFIDISIRIPDVIIVTKTGEFMIDSASGGIMSLIDLAWQIFLYSHDKEEFTVTIDEPENHLHPSMQRSLLGRITSAFPKAQFIVATHSPFIVSSVKDSSVYVLKYEDSDDETETFTKSRIFSLKLNSLGKAATASEILRDVLGVPVTLPEWAEDELTSITKGFDNQINPDTINLLRKNLDEAGLGEYYPEALQKLVGSLK